MAKTRKPVLLRPGEGTNHLVLGVSFTTKASTADSGGAYYLTELDINGEGPPPHVHATDDEAIYVIDGELELLSGKERVKASRGTFHLVPRGTVHTMASTRPTKVLLVFSPGETQGFIEEADRITDPEEVVAIAGKHGMEFPEAN